MDEDRVACIGLASKGYGGGDPDQVGRMAVETVVDILAFERFRSQYQETQQVLINEEAKKN